MSILFIDSSSGIVEFGYSREGSVVLAETLPRGCNADSLTYSIKESFKNNGFSFTGLKYVCLSNGPGSFTGLRIGSAIAKGICFAAGSMLIELPTLDIIANKVRSGRKVTSLLFSNMRTNEFYYSEYVFENKLRRISGYSTAKLEDILRDSDTELVINESNELLPGTVKDVSGISTIRSMDELAAGYISENKFSDYNSSEPFYMKEFTPKKN